MKIRVIDLETTGMPEDQVRGICEIGWADLTDDWRVHGPWSALVNPGHPIPAVTRAVHHISDADVAGAITPTQASAMLMEGMEPGDVFAAHNCAFERAFFGGGDFRWICTMKCARHLFPDAPGFSNQVLRYHLGIDADGMDFEASMPPHRAGPDALVTAHILSRLVFAANVERLIHLTTQLALLSVISFGKHRGQRWADLPSDYLRWIVDKSDLGADEKHTARHHLGAR